MQILLAALLFATTPAAFAAPASAAAPRPPRLVVLVVVDQLKPSAAPLDGPGFGRFAREGSWYTEARHGHIPTETAPGHAALATGRFPADSGIVGNSWWDRDHGREVAAVEDPVTGASGASNLLAPTLGELLRASSPASRSVSLAGKDRSAAMMGGRDADLVLWFEKEKGGFTSSAQYPPPPAWVGEFNAALSVPGPRRAGFYGTAEGDAAVLSLARRTIHELALGGDDVLDVLAVSLAANDILGHAKGPQSREVRENLSILDRRLGEFLSFLDSKVGRGRYLVALASDHGCLPTPESLEGASLGAVRRSKRALTAAVEAGLTEEFGAPGPGASWVLRLHPPHLYLNEDVARARGFRPEALRGAAARLLLADPGVERAYLPEDFRAGAGRPGAGWMAVRRGRHAARAGDVVFTLRPGVLLSDSPTDTTHGSAHDYDARIPLALLGAGVRKGVWTRPVEAVDLAPSLARSMGLPLSFTPGSSFLHEALGAEESPVLPVPAKAFPRAPLPQPVR